MYDSDGELMHPASYFPIVTAKVVQALEGLDATTWYALELDHPISLDNKCFELPEGFAPKETRYIIIAPFRFRGYAGRDIIAEELFRTKIFNNVYIAYTGHPKDLPSQIDEANSELFPTLACGRLQLIVPMKKNRKIGDGKIGGVPNSTA